MNKKNYLYSFILALIILSIFGCASTPAITPLTEEKELDFTNLVWSDEFDAASLNLESWNFNIGNGPEGLEGWGNNELEYYTDSEKNVRLEDGELIITAIKEEFEGFNYTSGKITSKNKVDVLFGRIEARIKLPEGKGIWPAFWMLPTDDEYGTWSASGELDIVELVGNEPQKIHGTIHFGGQWPDNKRNGHFFKFEDERKITDDYHVYAIEWTEEGIAWFIDDHQYSFLSADEWLTYTDEEDPNAPFDKRFYMVLNLAVGGNWPGNPDSTTDFPKEMRVDYIRVYR